MAASQIPLRINLLLAATLGAAQLWVLIGNPLVAGKETMFSLLVIAPVMLLTTTYWSVLHEAFHGNLHPDSRLNRCIGRGLAILFGAPFDVLRSGHLLHHRFNRTIEISEGYDPRRTPRWLACLRYYLVLLGGLYLAEVAASFVLLLPKSVWGPVLRRLGAHPDIAQKMSAYLARPDIVRSCRVDAFLSLALIFASFSLYAGASLPILVFMVGRGFLVSFFDNAYHYGTEVGVDCHARNLPLPRALSLCILHFNYHGVHHLSPGLPWSALPGLADSAPRMAYFSAAFAQLRGPIPLIFNGPLNLQATGGEDDDTKVSMARGLL